MKTQRILNAIECVARKMLTVSLCATACFLLSAVSHAQVLTSIANSVPAENVTIEIANSGSGLLDLQTRRTTTSENITVAQSFQWNTPRKLDAIGIYLSPSQASWAWGSGDVVNYTLWISSGPNNTVTPATLVATYSFDVLGTQISNTGNKYSQISGLNLSLTQGQWYAFYLAPTSTGTPTSRRLFWQTSSTSYTGMTASINNATPYTLPMNDSGFLGRDLTCYLTAVPEGLTAATSIVHDVPAQNVAINVANTGNNVISVQTRNTVLGLTDYAGIAQSFRWNSIQKLTGIGIYLNAAQAGAGFGWNPEDVVNYTLYIHTGSGAGQTGTRTPIATYTFDILGSDIGTTGDKYVYISGLDLSLINGEWYGFQIAPTPTGAPNPRRLFWDASNTDYVGNTQNFSTAIPYDGSYTNPFGSVKDFTFFMTTDTPAPAADVTIVNNVPTANVIIDVPNSGESILSVQTRNTVLGLTDYVGIAQSFQWNSIGNLDGIGLYLNAAQSGFPWGTGDVVSYTLHIHTGDGAAMGAPRNPVATYTLNILGEQISNTGDKYVYISGLDLQMIQGQWYGFQLAPTPTGAPSSRRLFWDSSNTTFAGNTQNFTTAISYDGTYNNPFGSTKDFTFFMTTPPTGSPYDDWAGGNFANPFPEGQRGAGVDFDSDGLSNLLEFVLGGDPTTNDSPSVRPSVIADGSNLVVTFKRSDASELAPAVSVNVQVSADLVTWNPADDILIGAATNPGPVGGANASYTVTNNAGLDTIVVTIPKGAATRKFARVVANTL